MNDDNYVYILVILLAYIQRLLSFPFTRMALQAWLIASVHFVHIVSKSVGACQHWGNCLNITCFKKASSSVGRAGSSLHPLTVHFVSISVPKTDSLASFTLSAPALLGPLSLAYLFMIRSVFSNFAWFISEDGRGGMAVGGYVGFSEGRQANVGVCTVVVALVGLINEGWGSMAEGRHEDNS